MTSKELLEKYVRAVMSAPHSLGLTAARDEAEFWQRHVLDALKLIELFPPSLHQKAMSVMDVGSGNGIPGLPAAIAVPSWNVVLMVSNSKKCGFIDMFCKFNDIKNVHVFAGRAEAFAHTEHRESYDLVFTRALGKLPTALELSAAFVKLGGTLVVPHGTSWEKELHKAQKVVKAMGLHMKDRVPYSVAPAIHFTALLFEKIAGTPEKYPRAVGIPAKRPL